MAYLILDIETIPIPSIDDEVELAITKKVQTHIEKTEDVEATHQLYDELNQYIN